MTSTSPSSTDSGARASTASVLARLPPLPAVSRPFFVESQFDGAPMSEAEIALFTDLIEGRGLDFMLAEVLDALPQLRELIGTLGPAGVTLQARPTYTLNALTIPTGDGAYVVFNLGFEWAMSATARIAAALLGAGSGDDREHLEHSAVDALVTLVDWSTSLAREPRVPSVPLPDELDSLAANIASRGHRFTLCHELGHVLDLARGRAVSTHPAELGDGAVVDAMDKAWDDEFDADREGLRMYLDVLAARGQQPVSALIGAELMLNTAGMLITGSTGDTPTHPPVDDRLARVRQEFLQLHGDEALTMVGPAMAVRSLLESLRHRVEDALPRTRAAVTQQLHAFADEYGLVADQLDTEQKRAAAYQLSRQLLTSPGATLQFLRDEITAPRAPGEPDGGSARRLLAYNAALHFEEPLRKVVSRSS